MNNFITNEMLSIATYSIWGCLLASALIGGLTGWFLRGTPKKKLTLLNDEWSERYADLEIECDHYRSEIQTNHFSENNHHNQKTAELTKKYKFLLTRTATLEKNVLHTKKAFNDSQTKLHLAETHIIDLKNQSINPSSSIQALASVSPISNDDKKVQQLTSSLNKTEQQLNHLKIELNSHQSEKQKLSDSVNHKDGIIQQLETQLTTIKETKPASLALNNQPSKEWYQKEIDQQQTIINQQKQDIDKQLLLYDEIKAVLTHTKTELEHSSQALEKNKHHLTNELNQRDQLIENLHHQIIDQPTAPQKNLNNNDKSQAAVRSLESYIDSNPLADNSPKKSDNTKEKIAQLNSHIDQLQKNIDSKDQEISLCMKLLDDKKVIAVSNPEPIIKLSDVNPSRSDAEIHSSLDHFFAPKKDDQETLNPVNKTKINQSSAPLVKPETTPVPAIKSDTIQASPVPTIKLGTIQASPVPAVKTDTTHDSTVSAIKPKTTQASPVPTIKPETTKPLDTSPIHSRTPTINAKEIQTPLNNQQTSPPSTVAHKPTTTTMIQSTANEIEKRYGSSANQAKKITPQNPVNTPLPAHTRPINQASKKMGTIELDSLLNIPKKPTKTNAAHTLYRASGVPHEINIQSNQGMKQDVSHLSSITGLDRRTAELLHQSGIQSILSLSQYSSDEVLAKITSTNKSQTASQNLPPKTRIEQWVKQAQLLVKNNN